MTKLIGPNESARHFVLKGIGRIKDFNLLVSF